MLRTAFGSGNLRDNEFIENLIQKDYIRDYVKMCVPKNAMNIFYPEEKMQENVLRT